MTSNRELQVFSAKNISMKLIEINLDSSDIQRPPSKTHRSFISYPSEGKSVIKFC